MITARTLHNILTSTTFITNLEIAIEHTDEEHEAFFDVDKVVGYPTYYTGEVKVKDIESNEIVYNLSVANKFYEDEGFFTVPADISRYFSSSLLFLA